MNWFPLSVKTFGKGCLPALLLALAPVADLPVRAQSLEVAAKIEVAQSADAAKNEALQKKAVQLLDLLAAKKYEQVRAMVSPELATKLSAEQIEQIWANLLTATGPFKKQLKSHVLNTITADLVVVPAEFEKTADDFIVIFNKKGEIVGVDFPKVDTIDKIAEIFVNALAIKDYARARGYLHPFLKTEVFPQNIQQKWEALLAQTGPVKRIVKTQVRPGSTTDLVDIVIVTIEFEKVTEPLFIIFDENRRITGVDFPQS